MAWRTRYPSTRSGWPVGVASQAKRWTLWEIDLALSSLLDVDRLLKASPHSDEHFVESWLLGLMVYSGAA